jgi:hypothetical protein
MERSTDFKFERLAGRASSPRGSMIVGELDGAARNTRSCSREQHQQLAPLAATLSEDGLGLLGIRPVLPARAAAPFETDGRPRSGAQTAVKLAAAVRHRRRSRSARPWRGRRGFHAVASHALGRDRSAVSRRRPWASIGRGE